MTVEGDIEFLFDSRGGVVAFRHGRDVFDLDLGWLGWAPWNDGDVFDPVGRYLGTITPDERLYEIEARRGLRSPPPRTPTLVSHPDPPRGCAPERLAAGMRDVRPRQLVRPHDLAASGAVVEVHDQEPERVLGANRPRELLAQPAQPESTVVGIGQRLDRRQPLEPVVGEGVGEGAAELGPEVPQEPDSIAR